MYQKRKNYISLIFLLTLTYKLPYFFTNYVLTVPFFRTRRCRVRTVPSSRANSSKHSKLDMEPVLGKRSRSASEEPFSSVSMSSNHLNHVTTTNSTASGHNNNSLEIRGTESLLQFTSAEDNPPLYSSALSHHAHQPTHITRPRRLAKVETIRVLRARSALLLPLPSPGIPPISSIPSSLSCQPLVLKSEDRKKKRR